jgi:hypothetical protein
VELKDWILICTSVFNSLVFGGTLWWGVAQYKSQRKHSFNDGLQANRSRLTEAYMAWHAALLSSPENIRIASSLMRRGHNALGGERGLVTPDQTHAVHLLYMLLNALFLEWNYRNLYSLDKAELDQTIDHALDGIINNPNPEYRDIADNFENIFDDFPSVFRIKISERINELRSRAVRSP